MATATELFINAELPKRPYTNQFPLTAGHVPVATGNGLETQARLLDVSDITNAASEQYVDDAINALIDNSPGALDTLNELAAALGDDPSFATTVSTSLSNRLRVDINTQGLTLTEKQNGLDNLGITKVITDASMSASGLITFAKNSGQTSDTIQIPTAISGLSFDANTGVLTSSYTNGATSTTITVATNEMADNVFRIKDNSDATKKIAFEASTVGTGQTRTITMPNANVNLANVPASYDATWLTLAGTTIDPKLNFTNSAGTLTQLSLKSVAYAQEYVDGATTQTITFGTRASTHFNIGNAGTGIVTFNFDSLASPYVAVITNNTISAARQVILQYTGGSIVENGFPISASPQTFLLDIAESIYVYKTGTSLRVSRSRSAFVASSDRSGYGARLSGTFATANRIISIPDRDVSLSEIGKVKQYTVGTAYETNDMIANAGSLYYATTNFTASTFGSDVVSNLSPLGIAGYIASVATGAAQSGSDSYFIGAGGSATNTSRALVMMGGTIGSASHTTSTCYRNAIYSVDGGAIGTQGSVSVTYRNCYQNTILNGGGNLIKNGSGRSVILSGNACILEGSQSSASHQYMAIVNGSSNVIIGADYGLIANGGSNAVYGYYVNGANSENIKYASVVNGSGNIIQYFNGFGQGWNGASISSGYGSSEIYCSTILNGKSCYSTGIYNVILGGDTNRLGYNGTTYTSATYSLIGTGTTNSITTGSNYCSILNGVSNAINNGVSHSVILSGTSNTISGSFSTILSGTSGIVSGNYSTIIAGTSNTISKANAVIVTGGSCTASGTGVVILGGQSVTNNLGGAVVRGPHQTTPTTCGAINQQATLIARVNGATTASLNTTAGAAPTNGTDTIEVKAAIANGMTGISYGSAIHTYMIAGKSVSGTFRTFTGKYTVSCSYDGTTYYIESVTVEHTTERSAPNVTVTFSLSSGNLICTIGNTDTGSDMWFSGNVNSMYI